MSYGYTIHGDPADPTPHDDRDMRNCMQCKHCNGGYCRFEHEHTIDSWRIEGDKIVGEIKLTMTDNGHVCGNFVEDTRF